MVITIKKRQEQKNKPIKLKNQKFYIECSSILQSVMTHKSTLRKEVYKKRDPKIYLAILSQVLKNKHYYNEIIDKLNFKTKNKYLSLLYVHEIINDKFEIENAVTKSIKTLSEKYSFNKEFKVVYIRLNTLKANLSDLDEIFENVNLEDKNNDDEKIVVFDEKSADLDDENTIRDFNSIKFSDTKNLNEKEKINISNNNDLGSNESTKNTSIQKFNNEIIEETPIPNIFKLKNNVKLYDLSIYKKGKIIIQNITSCLPAFILNPLPNSTIIDTCAAPGNKTSHLSMIMNNTGKIYAYEKNKDRFKILNQMIAKHGVKNTQTFNQDFLETDSELEGIDYILVDPSCSGSGIHEDYVKDDERIEKLSNFQKKILLHAMRFNGTKSVVYSTCSVHEEENEEVVKYVLERNSFFELKKIDVGIERVYKNGYDFSELVLRCEKNEKNNVQGFFVALFVRKKQ